jgi:hypothetical protein
MFSRILARWLTSARAIMPTLPGTYCAVPTPSRILTDEPR